MSTDVRPPQVQEARRTIGRLNPHWHPHITHYPWTPRAYFLAAIALAVMLAVLVIVLTFAFSAGKL
jgi:hypothetical protein